MKLDVSDASSNIFFTSDWHIGHHNILKYCKRPFKNVDEMISLFIRNYVERVSRDDFVFWLGDLTIRSTTKYQKDIADIIRALPGKKIFVRGNHDKYHDDFYINDCKFLDVRDKIETSKFIILHDYNNVITDKIVIHGHMHRFDALRLVDGTFFYDVGIDGNNYYPVTFKEINESIEQWEFNYD
jgi:calcineurin-like phosphoesterase family protein